jgi:hypothetical protein
MTYGRPIALSPSAASIPLVVTEVSCVAKARAGERGEKGRTCSASSM